MVSKVTAKETNPLKVKKAAGSTSVKKPSSLSRSNTDKKKAYLSDIRSDTLYPKFRMYISIIFITQIVIGSIVAVFSIFAFLDSEFVSGVIELIFSLIAIFSAYVTREVCKIFVDIADSILEKNSKKI